METRGIRDQLRDYIGNNHPGKRCENFGRLFNILFKNQMLKNETMIFIHLKSKARLFIFICSPISTFISLL